MNHCFPPVLTRFRRSVAAGFRRLSSSPDLAEDCRFSQDSGQGRPRDWSVLLHGLKGLGLSVLVLLAGPRVAAVDANANDIASDEILLGMSSGLTGQTQDLSTHVCQGVFACLERVNRAGGVRGKHLRLITLDDGYEPARTAPNMRRLIEGDQVLAVIGNVGTPTAVAAIPIAMEQKTLFFAGLSGGSILRKNPPDRYVINFRASYAEEAGAMIDALIDEGGLQPEEIAFFTQRDTFGDAGFSGAIAALRRHGLKDESAILHTRYERNTLGVENAVASLVFAEHPPRAVVMVGTSAPCAKFIKKCRAADLNVLFLNVSFVGASFLAHELGPLDTRVIVTQVVPHPLSSDLPIVREYVADLHKLEPGATPDFVDLEGYIAARIFVAALARIPGPPTREAIVDALEHLGRFDLGMGEPLELSPTEHQACHRVWPTVLRNGAFVPFEWQNIAGLVTRERAP
jgi:branched-chain amino acid transport system substrate-binding protein